MNKKTKTTTILSLIGLTLLSFTAAVTATDYTVLASKSTVKWTGYKPGGEHQGIVKIKSGTLSMEEDMITSGNIVIDMPTIKVTDSESTKLLNHLKGQDFFNVAKFPTSTLVLTDCKSLSVDSTGKHTLQMTGNMTILGKTQSLTFTAVNTAKTANYMFYNAKLTIDRTKFGITYKSSLLGDAMIKDNFDLAIKLIAKKN